MIVIEDKEVEKAFYDKFQGDKKKFVEFIRESLNLYDSDLKKLQISSMKKTWDNDYDKRWDEL